ncbi:MAG: tRNA (adenosine(37)-N6)-threonylcarbamoyltransferase complex dimerization subunit type 1 TsaB [Anaerolineales bacterium]
MILAVDTSTPQIGVALYNGARVLAEHLWVSPARHTVELAPMVENMLQQTGLTVSQLTALGVAIGPGSFTSLRVGLSFVKGLAMGRGLPLIGIPTLEVVAAPVALDSRPLACLLPAGRGRLAVGWFHAHETGWQAAGSPRVTTAEELSASIEQESLIAGDLTADERSTLQNNPLIRLISPALSTRRPGILAELTWKRLQTGHADDLHSLAPLYLHIGEPL